MLRMHCAELCAMVHTLPSRLPDSLMGEYASMMDSAAADATTRTIAPMSGSDSDVTETYHAAYARTLGEVLDTVRGTGSAGLDNAFLQAQRQWQIALDGVVNAAYKAAPRDSRKPIVGWRTMLDQYYTARKALMDLVYADAPEVGNEILMNLYKNAAVEAAQTFAK